MPRKLVADSYPAEWNAILQSNAFHYQLLNDGERARWIDDIQTFVATKYWEGCRGFEITEPVKVTIASQACLMLLGREHDCFKRVQTILVYPSGFKVIDEDRPPIPALGLAVPHGPVLLAWDATVEEARDSSSGRNVVIHEFAHQLDFLHGNSDGTLDLDGQGDRWRQVVTEEYRRLRRLTREDRATFLGDYAASNQLEFFASISETFFTQPRALKHHHPSLYAVFAETYAIDTEAWFLRHAQ
ncbi:MAG: zinc-dependent peptidase [Gemmataceae bacterium]